jgi:tight adherence protein B
VSGSAPFLPSAVAAAVLLVALAMRRWATSPPRRPFPAVPVDDPSRRLRALPRRRPLAPDDLDVAAWCERVGAGLRAGRSLTAAVVDADVLPAPVDDHGRAGGSRGARPARRPFAEVAHAVRRGRSLGEAFRAVPDDPSTPTGLAAPVLATCAELGGPAAVSIEGVADVLVARADERAERLTASAQARLSARVLTTVPAAVGALLAVTEPAVRHSIATPAGLVCVTAGAALNGAGWWWMRTMIRSAS